MIKTNRNIENPETFVKALSALTRAYKKNRINAMALFNGMTELSLAQSENPVVKAAAMGVKDSINELLTNGYWLISDFVNDVEGTIEWLETEVVA